MRGVGFREHGEIDRIELVDIPEPLPQAGEVRIEVRAAGLNRLDLFTLRGIPGVEVPRPHVVGSDASGVVDRLGEGVEGLTVGDRVLVNPGLWCGICEACRAGQEPLCREFQILGEHTQGAATRWVVVPRRNVHPIPEGLSFPEAAAFPLVFQTAWRAIRTVGALRPGERVAVIGAGGGVSTAAIQVAKRAGATVAAVSRSKARAERALELGADAALTYSDEEPLEKVLWRWSEKRGVDLIFDSVGRPTVGRSLKALGRQGRLVVIGATAGPVVELDLRTLFWRQASIRGSTMATRREFEEMLDAVRRGELRPVVDSTFPMASGRAAFERMVGGELFGKVVIVP